MAPRTAEQVLASSGHLGVQQQLHAPCQQLDRPLHRGGRTRSLGLRAGESLRPKEAARAPAPSLAAAASHRPSATAGGIKSRSRGPNGRTGHCGEEQQLPCQKACSTILEAKLETKRSTKDHRAAKVEPVLRKAAAEPQEDAIGGFISKLVLGVVSAYSEECVRDVHFLAADDEDLDDKAALKELARGGVKGVMPGLLDRVMSGTKRLDCLDNAVLQVHVLDEEVERGGVTSSTLGMRDRILAWGRKQDILDKSVMMVHDLDEEEEHLVAPWGEQRRQEVPGLQLMCGDEFFHLCFAAKKDDFDELSSTASEDTPFEEAHEEEQEEAAADLEVQHGTEEEAAAAEPEVQHERQDEDAPMPLLPAAEQEEPQSCAGQVEIGHEVAQRSVHGNLAEEPERHELRLQLPLPLPPQQQQQQANTARSSFQALLAKVEIEALMDAPRLAREAREAQARLQQDEVEACEDAEEASKDGRETFEDVSLWANGELTDEEDAGVEAEDFMELAFKGNSMASLRKEQEETAEEPRMMEEVAPAPPALPLTTAPAAAPRTAPAAPAVPAVRAAPTNEAAPVLQAAIASPAAPSAPVAPSPPAAAAAPEPASPPESFSCSRRMVSGAVARPMPAAIQTGGMEPLTPSPPRRPQLELARGIVPQVTSPAGRLRPQQRQAVLAWRMDDSDDSPAMVRRPSITNIYEALGADLHVLDSRDTVSPRAHVKTPGRPSKKSRPLISGPAKSTSRTVSSSISAMALDRADCSVESLWRPTPSRTMQSGRRSASLTSLAPVPPLGPVVSFRESSSFMPAPLMASSKSGSKKVQWSMGTAVGAKSRLGGAPLPLF